MSENPVLGCVECLADYGSGKSSDVRLRENRRCRHVDDAIAAAVAEAKKTALHGSLETVENMVGKAMEHLFALRTPVIGIIPKAKELMTKLLKDREDQILAFIRSASRLPAVCLDCLAKDAQTVQENGGQIEYQNGYVCEHWKPETWEAKGFKRNWGDAAVMDPRFEILRKFPGQEDVEPMVEYVILAPHLLRRPLTIHARLHLAGPPPANCVLESSGGY